MSLLDAPIWHDAGTWIVLGISLLFIVVGVVMHHIIMKVVRAPAPEAAPAAASAASAAAVAPAAALATPPATVATPATPAATAATATATAPTASTPD
jgi:predicted lipid-binding transport protein (Tim44 family)